MKLLMATCSDDNVKEYSRYTIPIFKMYAHRWNADFKILDDLSYKENGMCKYRTLIFYDLFKIYDKIFYLDSDIVINKNCPDVFDIVPLDTIGFVLEDKGSRSQERRRRIAKIKQRFGGNESWTKDYLNGGIYVVSRMHQDIFTKINDMLWGGKGFDCLHYMYQIKKFGYKYIDLGYKWNHMSMFSEPWNRSPSRFDSYIIHYAGGGNFPDKGERDRIELMADDVRKIYG